MKKLLVFLSILIFVISYVPAEPVVSLGMRSDLAFKMGLDLDNFSFNATFDPHRALYAGRYDREIGKTFFWRADVLLDSLTGIAVVPSIGESFRIDWFSLDYRIGIQAVAVFLFPAQARIFLSPSFNLRIGLSPIRHFGVFLFGGTNTDDMYNLQMAPLFGAEVSYRIGIVDVRVRATYVVSELWFEVYHLKRADYSLVCKIEVPR